VLGLVIAEALSERFPSASEGELARRYNRLVRGEACARVARTVGVGQYLILSESEAGSGGRAKGTILADAMEAILGAIFLDAGFDTARAVVRRLWASNDDQHPTSAGPDAKSALQEWAQGKGLALPEYVEVSRKGPDHAPRFTSEVRISGCAPARGEGASKRSAEQAAARALLEREGVPGAEMHE
jgi:ribonuclease-3